MKPSKKQEAQSVEVRRLDRSATGQQAEACWEMLERGTLSVAAIAGKTGIHPSAVRAVFEADAERFAAAVRATALEEAERWGARADESHRAMVTMYEAWQRMMEMVQRAIEAKLTHVPMSFPSGAPMTVWDALSTLTSPKYMDAFGRAAKTASEFRLRVVAPETMGVRDAEGSIRPAGADRSGDETAAMERFVDLLESGEAEEAKAQIAAILRWRRAGGKKEAARIEAGGSQHKESSDGQATP